MNPDQLIDPESEDPDGRWLTLDEMDKGMRMAAAKNGWLLEYDRPPLRGIFRGTVVAFPSSSGERVRIKRETGSYFTIHLDRVLRIWIPSSNEEGRS